MFSFLFDITTQELIKDALTKEPLLLLYHESESISD